MIDTVIAVLVTAVAVLWGLFMSVVFGVAILIYWDSRVSKQKATRNRKT